MDILGIGPMELAFILLIALIVLGPKDMVKAGKTLGKMLRKLVTSPTWQAVQQTSRDLRYLPNKLMREAGLDEDVAEIQKSLDMKSIDKAIKESAGLKEVDQTLKDTSKDLSAWTTMPTIQPPAGTSSGTQQQPAVESPELEDQDREAAPESGQDKGDSQPENSQPPSSDTADQA